MIGSMRMGLLKYISPRCNWYVVPAILALPSITFMWPIKAGLATVPRTCRSTSPASLAKEFWKFSSGDEVIWISSRTWFDAAFGSGNDGTELADDLSVARSRFGLMEKRVTRT